MNIRSTKRFFEENGVVAVKADKDKMPGVSELLTELGNTPGALPYYAVFAPGLDTPIHFGGNVITAGQVQDQVQEALDAAGVVTDPQQVAAAAQREP
ncbi:MAG: hypothetical protein ACR2NP_19110 [Pirellulaceae bacterium]